MTNWNLADVTIADASKILKKSERQIRSLEQKGVIIAKKTTGGHRRFKVRDLCESLLPPEIDRKIFHQLVDISCDRFKKSWSDVSKKIDEIDFIGIAVVERQRLFIYQNGWDWKWHITNLPEKFFGIDWPICSNAKWGRLNMCSDDPFDNILDLFNLAVTEGRKSLWNGQSVKMTVELEELAKACFVAKIIHNQGKFNCAFCLESLHSV